MSDVMTLREFTKLHGDYVHHGETGLCFSNGAYAENIQYGMLEKPHTEVNERLGINSLHVQKTLQRRLYYAQKKLGKCMRSFEAAKKDLESQANEAYAQGSLPPAENDVEDLRRLADEVKYFQAMAEAVESEINPAPQSQAPEHVQLNTVNRQNSKTVLETIKSIEV